MNARTQKIIDAFRIELPTSTEEKVIRALLDNLGATSGQLSSSIGWKSNSWHMHFGKLCKKRERYLWQAEYVEKGDWRFFSGILADFDNSRFTMKPEAVEAFAKLGIEAR